MEVFYLGDVNLEAMQKYGRYFSNSFQAIKAWVTCKDLPISGDISGTSEFYKHIKRAEFKRAIEIEPTIPTYSITVVSN
jgi:hypothetical protein